MKERVKETTSKMQMTDGATKLSLPGLSAHFGVELPNEYVEFMTSTNGAVGPIGENSFLQVWPAEEVIKLNSDLDYITDEHPEWLFFAGNGGGTWYAFDTKHHPQPVVEVDMIDPDNNEVRGASFEEFLENLYMAKE
jgi:hypothetical protein